MIKEIYRTIFLIILFVSLLIIGNQIIIFQFNNSTSILLNEYHELYALQDFKNSLVKLQNFKLENSIDDYSKSELDSNIVSVVKMKENCEQVVTKNHLNENWKSIDVNFNKLIKIPDREFFNTVFPLGSLYIANIIRVLDKMMMETNVEIVEAENSIVIIRKHGTITLLVSSVIFILIILTISLKTAKNITRSIQMLLSTFNKITDGDKDERAVFYRDDEFGTLAKEFNLMIDRLDKATVTLQYVKNIIDQIQGALFVTDINGNILFYNKEAELVFGYDNTILLNKHISILFQQNIKEAEKYNRDIGNSELIEYINSINEIVNSRGKSIPIMASCSNLLGAKEEGLIVLIHDISKKLEGDKKLDELKRKNIIAINEAQELERSRIASDIHDSLGQKLSAISYLVEDLLEERSDFNNSNNLNSLINEAVKETRELSHSLIPGLLKDFGLEAAIKDLITSNNNVKGVKLKFNCYGLDERLDTRLEKALYRICQEALNNIFKHSEARNATFQIFNTDDLITLMIEDDGLGFRDAKNIPGKSGIGILSIRERVYSFNGSLTINSNQDKGTELIIEVPKYI